MTHPNYVPSRRAILAVTDDRFIAIIRETEYVRSVEARLELESLVTGDPVYHPLGHT